MKIDVTLLQNLIEGSYFDKKTILILRHVVPIILVMGSNMPCINVLNCIHNFLMDKKFGIHQHACFKY